MNICDGKEETIPEWISGHLYKWKDQATIYLATDEKRLVDITTGRLYAKETSNIGRYTEDVTDQYCLQKTK